MAADGRMAAIEGVEQQSPKAICVDLDGTLSRTDTLLEAILMLAKRSPLSLLLLPFWVLKGKAKFKAAIARRTDFDPEALCYREALVDWLSAERKRGARLVLATGANETIAKKIAKHLGIFDEVI